MFLEAHVVGAGEIVDPEDAMTLTEQGICDLGADETSRASDDIGVHQSLITLRAALGTSLVALRASKTSWALSTIML